MSVITRWMPGALYRFLATGPLWQELVSNKNKLQQVACYIQLMNTYKSNRPISYSLLRVVHKITGGKSGCSSVRDFVDIETSLQKEKTRLQKGLDARVESRIKKIGLVVGIGLLCAAVASQLAKQVQQTKTPFSPNSASASLYDEQLRGDLEHCPRSVLSELQIADQNNERSLVWEGLASNAVEKREVCEKLASALSDKDSFHAAKVISEDCEGLLENQTQHLVFSQLQKKDTARPFVDVLTGQDIDLYEKETQNDLYQTVILTQYAHQHLCQRLMLASSQGQIFKFFGNLASQSAKQLMFLEQFYRNGLAENQIREGYQARNNLEALKIVNQYATQKFSTFWKYGSLILPTL